MSDEEEWKGGYRKPPHKNRFPKGVSGNPAGRKPSPPRVMAMGERALEALREPIAMTINGKKVMVPALDAIIIKNRNLALKSENLLHGNRFLDRLEKLGFNYLYEEGGARAAERVAAEAMIDQQAKVIDVCHAQLRAAVRKIEMLERKIGKLSGQQPDEGYPVD